jgi:phenylalanyl-tRNA synthetase beta subunit
MIKFDKENAIYVENPQSEEYTMLRQTLAANMLNCLKYNWDNGQKNLWFYELGKTYVKVAEADDRNAGVREAQVLSGIMCGNKENRKWSSATSKVSANVDFYSIKGVVDKLLKEFNLDKRVKYQLLNDSALANTHTVLHPYKTAVLTLLGKQPQVVGYYGELHPELAAKLKINQPAFLFCQYDQFLK